MQHGLKGQRFKNHDEANKWVDNYFASEQSAFLQRGILWQIMGEVFKVGRLCFNWEKILRCLKKYFRVKSSLILRTSNIRHALRVTWN